MRQSLQTLLPSVFAVLLKPCQFFADISRDQRILHSVIFLFATLFIPSASLAILITPEHPFSTYALITGISVFATLIWTAYLQWCVRTFIKKDVSFAEILHLSAHSTTPAWLGSTILLFPIAWVWQTYLNWVGLCEHSKVSREAAGFIVWVPFVMSLSAILAFLMFVGLSGFDMVTPAWEWFTVRMGDFGIYF